MDIEITVTPEERAAGRLGADRFRLAALLLHTAGCVVLRDALPAELVAAAAAAHARILRDCVESRQGDGWYQVSRREQAVFWERGSRWRIFPKLRPPLSDPDLLANPIVMELLTERLGEECFCKFVSSDTCLRGSSLQSPHREMNAGGQPQPVACVVNVPLTRCGPDNGPLEVWPVGSHLWSAAALARHGLSDDVQDGSNPAMEVFSRRWPSRRLLLEPGTVLIRDAGTLHRGTPNLTDEPRTLLTLCYFRQGHTHDYGTSAYNLDTRARPATRSAGPAASRRSSPAPARHEIVPGAFDTAPGVAQPDEPRRALVPEADEPLRESREHVPELADRPGHSLESPAGARASRESPEVHLGPPEAPVEAPEMREGRPVTGDHVPEAERGGIPTPPSRRGGRTGRSRCPRRRRSRGGGGHGGPRARPSRLPSPPAVARPARRPPASASPSRASGAPRHPGPGVRGSRRTARPAVPAAPPTRARCAHRTRRRPGGYPRSGAPARPSQAREGSRRPRRPRGLPGRPGPRGGARGPPPARGSTRYRSVGSARSAASRETTSRVPSVDQLSTTRISQPDRRGDLLDGQAPTSSAPGAVPGCACTRGP